MKSASDGNSSRQVYFEFLPIGAQVKVSAIDAVTRTEVCIIAPRATLRKDMETLAVRKLQRALDRLGQKG
uniref:DUF6898 family protein n=1 Tax=Pararhizobium sp. IMCC3301 TaxID=3067904 RepID=UPI002741B191|nr:serine hydroxymethyltransferase [Pararhizobium sp. IMCC3301]